MLIEPELVQDRSVDIAKMDRIFDRAQTDVIGGADDFRAVRS